MKKYILLLTGLLLANQAPLFAAEQLEATIRSYQQQGNLSFSIEAGKALWEQKIAHKKSPTSRSCASCHGSDLTISGKHIKTNKIIKPMSSSTNPGRFNNQKKIEKWFLRNCKWTWGRECSAQEKGDILRYLSQQ
ncbi:MAG: DUF1924 domain-containing protein [Gammaproteobacteria bacterium]|nr:DUF1924 domain-containing protein [Gammaproteobacteria bacterium]